jgi:ketosteroid isomerase-like protein
MTMLDARGRSIADVEDALLAAMRASDVDALDELIADRLVFTLPDGSTIGKKDDVEAHRSGRTRFLRIDERSRSIRDVPEGVATELTAEVELEDGDRQVTSTLTWRRTWMLVGGHWKVVEGSVAPA